MYIIQVRWTYFSWVCKTFLPAYSSAKIIKIESFFSRVMMSNVLPRFFRDTVYITIDKIGRVNILRLIYLPPTNPCPIHTNHANVPLSPNKLALLSVRNRPQGAPRTMRNGRRRMKKKNKHRRIFLLAVVVVVISAWETPRCVTASRPLDNYFVAVTTAWGPVT